REDRAAVVAEAEALVIQARRSSNRQGVVESFLQEFSLGTREGLVLMSLAEALLRTPDEETRDALIAEKISSADWASHLGQSENLFVNASTWGLMLTGQIVDVGEEAKRDLGGFIKRVANRLGEPVIRAAIAQAIRIMGEQFVLGRNIESALRRARKDGWLCSFDMLGEGARTAADAERYEKAYAAAIEAVGAARENRAVGPEGGHGVSVKLSALSPRYEATQEARVWSELYPRIRRLALIAARHDLNLCIDAEEADRLVISLKLLDRLAREPELGGWTGLGLAVQAYQKRGVHTIEAVARLARESGRRLMVRLVKGAYWDSEIKRAQVNGRPDYPVWTSKSATDLSYLVCAQAVIEAAPHLYGQFATHNAHTLAAVKAMADRRGVKIEFQRLHGMGEALYDAANARWNGVVLRAYAPVGGHEDLLPYLVRRLLENGANTSFVHVLLDANVPASAVVEDPIGRVEARRGPHPRIPKPRDLYGDRPNSAGVDLASTPERERLLAAIRALDGQQLISLPLVGRDSPRSGQGGAGSTTPPAVGLPPNHPHPGVLRTPSLPTAGEGEPVRNPADHSQVVGTVVEATPEDIEAAFAAAKSVQRQWDEAGGPARARILRAMGDALESDMDRLIAIACREAGKTLVDGVAEVREAVDFCRYYALLAERQFGAPEALAGPAGETNSLSLHGRGVFVCISPWNFPLAIFTGQIAAALAAGNAVLAKPAEQTPLIAAEAVRLFHKAGLDPRLLHLLPGRGETVGAALTAHPGIAGVAFTGGTDTARLINRTLAGKDGPIVPLIAETGGLNGMFVDTTALREQVIDDVILSAFGSAGQRCSALRLLFLPEPSADGVIEGLAGAMDALVMGDPADPATDIGPVIDEESRGILRRHEERVRREARVLKALEPGPELARGAFFTPLMVEVPFADFLEREVFGPVLHIVRYDPDKLDEVAGKLAARGFGLTLGVHSRIEGFWRRVQALVPAGNVYVNRSIIGAVVGVQPFGGEGLSGTGPKAGGPHALSRYAVERAVSINITAQGGDPTLLNLGS
ncbi:MAG: bifunctional proline dehydrogenase/L-glutamate gamma-semialdehyde dehydrogenase PutA, partial [Pseudomonadota bacterium]|nr:bifunctional proline dehydrogenase/L-glutamate gamma-semialdehyde dehydrogenase PutA [Pseudomonadota bacterium]